MRRVVVATYQVAVKTADGMRLSEPVMAENAEEAQLEALRRYGGTGQASVLAMTRGPWLLDVDARRIKQ